MANRYSKLIISAFIPFTFICLEAKAEMIDNKQSCCSIVSAGHFYIGAFGGGGPANNPTLIQKGTAFFPPASGGALAVNAQGNAHDNSAGIGGLHVGYEWGGLTLGSQWDVLTALELEGYYLGITQNGALINPTTRLPEHDFHDTFPMNVGVFLANAVWTIKIPNVNWLDFYLGGGVGTSVTSISGANSKQVSPLELGINHFNSKTNASDWSFAAQAKAGVHFVLTPNWRLLAEYRFLHIDSTNFTFGSTKYPTHVPTTNWNVTMGSTNYNMGVAGIEYVF